MRWRFRKKVPRAKEPEEEALPQIKGDPNTVAGRYQRMNSAYIARLEEKLNEDSPDMTFYRQYRLAVYIMREQPHFRAEPIFQEEWEAFVNQHPDGLREDERQRVTELFGRFSLPEKVEKYKTAMEDLDRFLKSKPK